MMYALGDMDGIICLAGALCKTWALLFTGEFGSRSPMINANGGLTHVRGGVWSYTRAFSKLDPAYPRARGSLGNQLEIRPMPSDLPTCAGEFGGYVRIYPKVVMTYPRVQRSLVVRVFLVCS